MWSEIFCFVNKLHPQMPSTGFSDELSQLVQRKFSTVNLLVNLQKTLVFFQCTQGAEGGKMGKKRKDTEARVAARRKEI